MTGWRLNAALGPKLVIDVIARLNVNIESCTRHFIQHAGVDAPTGDQSGGGVILRTFQERRDVVVRIVNSIPGIQCLRPQATFHLYPDATGLVKHKGFSDYDTRRTTVLQKTGVSFCAHHRFGRELAGENQFHFRMAYSGINAADIEEGWLRLKKSAGD